MSIQEQFNKFYDNIKLTSSQRDDAKKKYTGVCKKLHSYYYPSIKYDGTTKLLIGSYGKKTNIRPPRDVDVLFIMPEEKFEQYDDNKSNGQSQLLQDIKNILADKYTTTDKIKGWGKVVLIEFTDGTHNVELLPAWENKNTTFEVPNTKDGGSWETWNPRSEIQAIKDSDNETGKTKALIRMIKKWSENCSAKLSSYEIENKILDFHSSYDVKNKDYSKIVTEFFKFFLDDTNDDDNLKSHLNTAYKRSEKACAFEDDEKLDDATDEWKKIFGDDFPLENNKKFSAKSLSYDDPALADYSHCESLRWPFYDINKVSIDAYIYTKSKVKKIRRN